MRAHVTSYRQVGIGAVAVCTAAGDASASWSAVSGSGPSSGTAGFQPARDASRLEPGGPRSLGNQALSNDQEWGWIGRIDGDVEERAADLAVDVWRDGPGMPALATASSKGDTHIWDRWLTRGHGHPFAAAPGALQGRVARACGIPYWVGTPVAAACSSGLTALLTAADAIERGQAVHGLVVAADDPLQPWLLACYRSMGASCGSGPPPTAFSAEARGFAPAQGAAALTLGHPGHTPWRLTAGVLAADAAHATRFGSADAVRATLEALWSIAPHPDLIITHGTGTPVGDAIELAALQDGPWSSARRIACKPVFGHTLGASGLIELACAVHSGIRVGWKLSLGFAGHIAAVAWTTE